MDIAKRKGVVVWLTGISDAGKSTIARALATRMQTDGIRSMVLDGDVLQTGLNSDRGFSEAELTENLRRVAHVAALFCNEGYVVVTATISPNPEHRENQEKSSEKRRTSRYSWTRRSKYARAESLRRSTNAAGAARSSSSRTSVQPTIRPRTLILCCIPSVRK